MLRSNPRCGRAFVRSQLQSRLLFGRVSSRDGLDLDLDIDKGAYVKDVVDPLVGREEPVYAVPGSDPEDFPQKRFPHKQLRRVGGGLRPRTIRGLLDGMPLRVSSAEKRKVSPLPIDFPFTGARSAHDDDLCSRSKTHNRGGQNGVISMTPSFMTESRRHG